MFSHTPPLQPYQMPHTEARRAASVPDDEHQRWAMVCAAWRAAELVFMASARGEVPAAGRVEGPRSDARVPERPLVGRGLVTERVQGGLGVPARQGHGRRRRRARGPRLGVGGGDHEGGQLVGAQPARGRLVLAGPVQDVVHRFLAEGVGRGHRGLGGGGVAVAPPSPSLVPRSAEAGAGASAPARPARGWPARRRPGGGSGPWIERRGCEDYGACGDTCREAVPGPSRVGRCGSARGLGQASKVPRAVPATPAGRRSGEGSRHRSTGSSANDSPRPMGSARAW